VETRGSTRAAKRNDPPQGVADIDRMFEKLVAEARGLPIVVLHGLPQVNSVWLWTGEPGAEAEYIDIARQTGARILYSHIEVFDFKTEVRIQVLGSDIDFQEDEGEPQQVAAAYRALDDWSGRSGETAWFRFRFLVDGIAHDLHVFPEWFDKFMAAVDGYIPKLESEWTEQEAESRQFAMAEQKREAEELARSERYAKAKNESQRRYVAEEMFPSKDRWEIDQLAELAALVYWDKVEPERERALALKADELYEGGLSMVEVAARLGVSKDRLNRVLAMADEILGPGAQ
jgi:hypothetical protein